MLLGILALALSLESTTDSIVVRRLVAPQPNRIQLDKRWTMTAGPSLDSAVVRFQRAGFDAAADSIAVACNTSRRVFGYSIAVFSGSDVREVVVTDDCAPTSPAMTDVVTKLRTYVRQFLRSHGMRQP